ncbi:MAG: marine proteobacterial sortase target protein [Cellvibrionaceae bacterium]|nr:marine proteobacterial sortase target protein [Cellvibrionaceae bacterium]
MLFLIYSKRANLGILDSKAKRLRRAKFNEGIGWTVLSIMALAACMFISSQVRADELQSVGAGEIFFAEGKSAVHLATEVQASITGLVAQVNYKQRFRNSSPNWQEATYIFPLPENAAVNGMQLRVGERVIAGQIKEKQQAQQIYRQAMQQGKKAALLGQQRSNVFRQRIANVAPDEEVVVEISYLQTLDYSQGRFEWRLPTTLTPRYVPGVGQAGPAQNYNSNALESEFELDSFGWAPLNPPVMDANKTATSIAPRALADNPLSLSVQLNAGLPLAEIDALYHKIAVTKQGDRHQVSFLNQSEPMDRDVVLQWRPVASSAPSAAVFNQRIDLGQSTEVDGDYALLMVLPPASKSAEHTLPRDMIFVIDTSGSMQGESIRQARQSLALALARLKPNDRFNIIEFNSDYSQLFSGLHYADSENVARAQRWVRALQAQGGTEIYPALHAALGSVQQDDDDRRVRQVLFITDGAIANEHDLLRLINEKLGNARLFTVGIGSAPNSYFMKKAAQFGKGSFTFIGDSSETQSHMNALFNKIETIAATNISIQWPQSVEFFPKKIPDLYAGEPLLLLAKSAAMQGEVIIEGDTAGQYWREALQLDAASKANAGVATLWARQKIESLEDEKIEGRDSKLVRAEVLPLALAHKLVTAYTNFVAVETTPSRLQSDPLKSSGVGNLVAQGQHLSQLAYPQTASPMILHLLLSGIFALLLFVARWCYTQNT